MKKKMWLIMLLMNMWACGGNSSGSETPDPEPAPATVDIYPQPPSGWMGTSNPYNTTGWVGDIMPFFDKGRFHIFFLHDAQQKPAGQGFHDIHKFESTNLKDFSYSGRMIPYGATSQPDFAVGTGSTVKVGSTYYMYYTGHNGNPGFVAANPRESVLYATSQDLQTWTKKASFKLTAPAGYYNFDFRDPQVFFNEEKNEYWMLVSTQTSSRKAVVLLFATTNPAADNWTLKGPLYTTTEEDNYLMMECADVFKMGNFWYMFFSEDWGVRGTHYRMATSSQGPWIKPAYDMLDGQYFYAAKTASDGAKRYLFGWTARKNPENDQGNKEWAGNMVIHELTQATDGTLGVKVPDAVGQSFPRKQGLTSKGSAGTVTSAGNTFQLTGNSADAHFLFSPLTGANKITAKVKLNTADGTAGFLFNADNPAQQSYKIVFEPGNNRVAAYQVSGSTAQLISRVSLPVPVGTAMDVTFIQEGSVAVLYVNGQAALSNRIYGLSGKAWGLFANNTQAEFQDVNVFGPK